MSVFDEMGLDELRANRSAIEDLLAMRTKETDPVGYMQYQELLAYIDERINKMTGKKTKSPKKWDPVR